MVDFTTLTENWSPQTLFQVGSSAPELLQSWYDQHLTLQFNSTACYYSLLKDEAELETFFYGSCFYSILSLSPGCYLPSPGSRRYWKGFGPCSCADAKHKSHLHKNGCIWCKGDGKSALKVTWGGSPFDMTLGNWSTTDKFFPQQTPTLGPSGLLDFVSGRVTHATLIG